VIFGVLIIIGFLIVRGLFLLAKYIDQQSDERRRFYLSVAEDLERMDKIIKQKKHYKPKEPKVTLFDKRWAGRN
jgi:hypothetical protein